MKIFLHIVAFSVRPGYNGVREGIPLPTKTNLQGKDVIPLNIILSADRTCDLTRELCESFDVHTIPYHITLEGKEYRDSVDIVPEELYRAWWDRKVLPHTSAINAEEYVAYFRPWVEAGYEVIHFCLGSALSSSCQNCFAAAEMLGGHVHPVDSHSLSTGTALQVMDCREHICAGESAEEIARYFNSSTRRYHASFILDTLEFMHAGGRCSAVAAFGANLLKLKPCIEVDNTSGGMGVGKKYRGKLENVLAQYTREKLARYSDIRTDRIFITHSGIEESYIHKVRETILQEMQFDNIYVTQASCTISSHCGPNTLGILFATESEEA